MGLFREKHTPQSVGQLRRWERPVIRIWQVNFQDLKLESWPQFSILNPHLKYKSVMIPVWAGYCHSFVPTQGLFYPKRLFFSLSKPSKEAVFFLIPRDQFWEWLIPFPEFQLWIFNSEPKRNENENMVSDPK